jgi:hypothetical protein
MFLTLLLLGLGVSYYCLRRRPVRIVRRMPVSIGTGSEITQLSEPSVEFMGLKIPRVAPLPLPQSSSETITTSDYPPSDLTDSRSSPVS